MDAQTRPLTQTQRLKHQCGRFLGELKDGTLYVACGRCNDLVPVVMDHVVLEDYAFKKLTLTRQP